MCDNSLLEFGEKINRSIEKFYYFENEEETNNGDLHIVNLQGIEKESFDYYLIMTEDSDYSERIAVKLMQLNILQEKILEYCYFVKEPRIPQIAKFVSRFLDVKYDSFILGMSHSYGGLIEEMMSQKIFKFSAPSMDLYYHYMVLKEICSLYDMSKIKNIIIEIPYYAFNYDISMCKSVFEQRLNYYYYFGDYHHYGENEEEKRQIIMFDRINHLCENMPYINRQMVVPGKSTIYERHILHIVRKWKSEMRFMIKRPIPRLWEKKDIQAVRMETPHVWYNRHEDTIVENLDIWNAIKRLIANYRGVRLLVCVFPLCPYFNRFHTEAVKNMKDIFYSNLNLPKDNIIDLFSVFEDHPEYFSDISHLNGLGAYHLTKILDKYLLTDNV